MTELPEETICVIVKGVDVSCVGSSMFTFKKEGKCYLCPVFVLYKRGETIGRTSSTSIAKLEEELESLKCTVGKNMGISKKP